MTGMQHNNLRTITAMVNEALPTAPWVARGNMLFDCSNRPLFIIASAITPLCLRYLTAMQPAAAKSICDLIIESMPVWSWAAPVYAGRYYARKGPASRVHVLHITADAQGWLAPAEDEPQADLAAEALRSVWQWAKLPDPVDFAR